MAKKQYIKRNKIILRNILPNSKVEDDNYQFLKYYLRK